LQTGRLSESDFFRYLNRQIEQAQPISPYALSTRNIRAYSWSEDDAEALGLIGQAPAIESNGTFRYGVSIDVTEDVYRLIVDALTLKEKARDLGERNTVWIGRPNPEDRNALRRRAA